MRKLFTSLSTFIGILLLGTNLSFGQYCTPIYTTGCSWGDGLTFFGIGSINQTIPCPPDYNDYTATQSTNLQPNSTATVTMIAGYSTTYVTVWIDYNNNGVFETSEIVVNSYNCVNASTPYTSTFTVPTGYSGNLRLRFRTNWLSPTTDPCNSLSFGNAADFTVILPQPNFMMYDTAYATHPDTNIVFQGQNLVKMLKGTVVTHNGTTNPVPISKIYLSTSGTSNLNDLSALRVFVADGNPLNINDTFGPPILNPGGQIELTFPPNTTLGYGQNNLWFAYDVNYLATEGNYIDLRIDSAMIDDTMRVLGAAGDPVGRKQIVHPQNYNKYCDVQRTSGLAYEIGLNRVKWGSIDNVTAVFTNTGSCVQFYTPLSNPPVPIPTFYRPKSYPIMIQHAAFNNRSLRVFIDWNNNGFFDNDELVKTYNNVLPATKTFDNIEIPCHTTTGMHRVRFSVDADFMVPVACGSTTYGEVEDYLIYIAPEETPVVSFTTGDTVAYVGGQTVFNPESSVDGNMLYLWDYDNNGIVDDTAAVGKYVFGAGATGTRTVGLRGVLLGCHDTLYSNWYYGTVQVIMPTTAPDVDFIASANTVTPSIPVTLTDLSTQGPFQWQWVISPATVNGNPSYTFLSAPDAQHPRIQFLELGVFDIKLIATNYIGTDSLLKTEYIYVGREQIICTDKSSDIPSGYLYDDGGKYGNYSNPAYEQLCTYTISPKCASSITIDFLDFDVCSYGSTGCPNLPPDNIKIYDGVDNTGTPLHLNAKDMFGNPIYPQGYMNGPGNAYVGLPPSVSANSGSMYIEFFKNCGGVGTGFEARWSTVSYVPVAPVSSFIAPDTVYRGAPYTYSSTATGEFLDYFWDFEGNGIYSHSGNSVTYTYTSTGAFTLKHKVESCSDLFDIATKTIIVIDPPAKPPVNFTVDFQKITPVYVAQFTDLSHRSVNFWEWTITPNTVSFMDGTHAHSKNPRVQFHDTGYYDVQLKVANILGSDSLIRNKYMNIYLFCTPGIGNLNADLGMSEVVLSNMNGDTLIYQASTIGTIGYTDYTEKHQVVLSKGGQYILSTKRNSNFNNITRSVWIDYNKDGLFDQPDRVLHQYNSHDLAWTDTFLVPLSAPEGLTRLRVGANNGILNNKGCGPNLNGEFEDYAVVISPDKTAPVITLNPPDTVLVNPCGTYNEPGYQAFDDVNGDISPLVTVTGLPINTAIADTHTFYYDVQDFAGNNAVTKSRTVVVLANNIPPQITILGKNPDSVRVFNTYNDPGFNAQANCGTIVNSATIGSVNSSIVGTYTIGYYAEDNVGNKDTVFRTVCVYDDIDPTITLNGADSIAIEVHNSFNDPGVTINDNYYSGLQAVITGSVDTSKLGLYFLTYCVSDPSDNGPVCVDRMVFVYDRSAPHITLLGGDTILLDVFTNYVEPGYEITDNYWSEDNIIVKVSDNINTYQLGTYEVTYLATDGSGNTSVIYKRIVQVVDRVAPDIQLKGNSIVTVMRWTNFLDPGVIVSDNYDSKYDIIVHNTPNATFENTNAVGLFIQTYVAEDLSGNKSEEISRLIYVEENTTGIYQTGGNEFIKFYPNPAQNELNIEVHLPQNDFISISVYNALGQQVSQVFNGMLQKEHITVDLTTFSNGLYYLKADTENGNMFNEKFIIAK
jgi:PKD repeat protein